MAIKVTATFRDAQGTGARTEFNVANELDAISVLQSIADLTNAQIVNAYYGVPVDLAFLANNNAVAANIETVRSKLRVLYRGQDLDPTAVKKFPTVQLYIPAPVGTIFDGTDASLQGNANLQAFIAANRLITPYGVTMTEIVGGGYSSR